jgi:colanic acid/amylovoran biosynthesis glycosyltransferase
MNILMIGCGNPPSTFISRQIQGLNQIGIEVNLLPDLGQHQYLSAQLLNAGFTFQLSREIKDSVRQADLLHFQWPGHWLAFYQLARRFGKPSVVSLRGRQINILPYIPGNENYAKKLQHLLPKCDAYHCVSQAILEEAKLFGLQEERAYVIRPAVDPGFFIPPTSRSFTPPLKMVMVGALMWRKGYDYALLGVKQAVDFGFDVVLNIIGDGPDVDRIQYMIDGVNLRNNVHLLGKKNSFEVNEYLQSSHILLHTSLSEGIANVILEAMACEDAIITTSVGGIGEVIQNGENGLLIPARDPEAIFDRIKQIYENPDLLLNLGKNARKDVQKNHTLSQQAEQFLSMYEKVLGYNHNGL